MNWNAYPMAVAAALLAAMLLVPSLLAPVPSGATPAPPRISANHPVDAGSERTSRLRDSGPAESGVPFAPRNATSLVADGTFDAIPGPWTYTNGTTGVVTAEHDPTARARLGASTPVLRFDSMDDIFGPSPWVSMISNPGGATSNLSQATVTREEGTGSMRDDVMILANGNRWGGALRNDP